MAASSMTTSVASFIDRHITASGKTLYCIAEECGLPKSNMLSMIRKGNSKLPLARVPALAKSLRLDERALFEMAVKEYQPDLWNVLDTLYWDGNAQLELGRLLPH